MRLFGAILAVLLTICSYIEGSWPFAHFFSLIHLKIKFLIYINKRKNVGFWPQAFFTLKIRNKNTAYYERDTFRKDEKYLWEMQYFYGS